MGALARDDSVWERVSWTGSRLHAYPRGNFSVMPGPHRRGHERSLGRGFPAGPGVFRGPVRPAFALALYGGALTRLSARGCGGLFFL